MRNYSSTGGKKKVQSVFRTYYINPIKLTLKAFQHIAGADKYCLIPLIRDT